MQPVVTLVRVNHGSTLYGTSTSTSDQDFKGVHLPSGEGIIMQRPEDVIDSGVVAKEGTKNTSEAIDSDSYSLQKFFDMLIKGDTVATEILFAEPIYAHPDWTHIQNRARTHLLNRKCKGFVGYCQRQAAKYGVKGSRMAAVKGLLELLTIVRLGRDMNAKLSAVEPELRKWSEGREHVSWENIPHPNGEPCWHIVCCDRKMPMTVAISEASKVYLKVWENYGERARAAMNNEGIDWKAMSHALRVAGQAIELLDTGRITFPRPDAAMLLMIKQGNYDYGFVSAMLEGAVAEVERASQRSILPENSSRIIADALVLSYYRKQVLS